LQPYNNLITDNRSWSDGFLVVKLSSWKAKRTKREKIGSY
jgi:hypothetical protein